MQEGILHVGGEKEVDDQAFLPEAVTVQLGDADQKERDKEMSHLANQPHLPKHHRVVNVEKRQHDKGTEQMETIFGPC